MSPLRSMTSRIGDVESSGAPPRAVGLAEDDLGRVALLGVADQLVRDVLAGDRDRLAAEAFGETERLGHALLGGLAPARERGGFDEDGEPLDPPSCRQPPGRAHQALRQWTVAHADQDTLGHRPRAADGMRAHVGLHLVVDALGGVTERELTERGEVARREVVGERALGRGAEVDLALLRRRIRSSRRQVDELDLVGALEDAVGDGLAHSHAGDLGDDVVQALEVLDVDRGVDVDAGLEQLLDVGVALGVTAALDVGVRELVDQHDRGTARQDGVEVHLVERLLAVLDGPLGDDLETLEERLGLGSAMGLDHPDDDVDALALPLTRRLEHGVGLADPGGGPHEDAQPAAFGAVGHVQQCLRGWASLPSALPARHWCQSIECPERSVGPRSRTRVRGSSRRCPAEVADPDQGRPGPRRRRGPTCIRSRLLAVRTELGLDEESLAASIPRPFTCSRRDRSDAAEAPGHGEVRAQPLGERGRDDDRQSHASAQGGEDVNP